MKDPGRLFMALLRACEAASVHRPRGEAGTSLRAHYNRLRRLCLQLYDHLPPRGANGAGKVSLP
jgi:hypothetical protein